MYTNSIKLENRIGELPRLTEFLEKFLRNLDICEDEIFAVVLAMEELFVNKVSYGYADKQLHIINVHIQYDKNNSELTIKIEDDGTEFNILEKPDPNLTLSVEERPIGGLGIFFIKKKMDSVCYHRKKNLNLIIFKKQVFIKS